MPDNITLSKVLKDLTEREGNLGHTFISIFSVLPKIEMDWGWEIILCDKIEYCSKLLILNERMQTDHHRHRKRCETILALTDELEAQVGFNQLHMVSYKLDKGDRKDFNPGRWHRLGNYSYDKLGVFLEISTAYDPGDIEIHRKGGELI